MYVCKKKKKEKKKKTELDFSIVNNTATVNTRF